MNAEKFTQKSLQAVQSAQNVALEYGNAEITTLHFAYALSEKDGLNYRILRRAGVDADGLCRALKEEIERIPRVSGGGQCYPTQAFSARLPRRKNSPTA